MKKIPEFRVAEEWGNGGNVDVWFDDNLPYALQKNIARKLQSSMKYLDNENHCVYGLKKAIEGYFDILVERKELAWSSDKTCWNWNR